MRIDLITKLAKHGIFQHLPNRRTHTYHAFSKSYYSLIKVRGSNYLNNPFFKKSSYSTSASSGVEGGGIIAWYLRRLENRPLLTKAVSCSLIYAAADVTTQMIAMEPGGSFDLIRSIRIGGYGLLFLGPAQHVWFNFLGKLLPNRNMISILKKIGMGQLIFGPIVLGVFFSYNAALQGENGHEIMGRLKRDMVPTLLSGLVFWPLCDLLTFRVIPVHLQPLVNSSFAYLWSIYLTYMASREKA